VIKEIAFQFYENLEYSTKISSGHETGSYFITHE